MEQSWTETRHDRPKTSGETSIRWNVSVPFVTPAEMIHGVQDRNSGNAASETRTMFRKIPAMSAPGDQLPCLCRETERTTNVSMNCIVTFPADVSGRVASVSAMNAPTPGTATTVLTLEGKPEVFDR